MISEVRLCFCTNCLAVVPSVLPLQDGDITVFSQCVVCNTPLVESGICVDACDCVKDLALSGECALLEELISNNHDVVITHEIATV